MPSVFSVSIAKIIKEIRLQEVYLPRTAEEIMISSRDINRPGIEISGFFDYFDEKRIQILGRAEVALLKEMEPERRLEILEAFFSRKPAVVILSRNLDVPEGMLEAAKKIRHCHFAQCGYHHRTGGSTGFVPERGTGASYYAPWRAGGSTGRRHFAGGR